MLVLSLRHFSSRVMLLPALAMICCLQPAMAESGPIQLASMETVVVTATRESKPKSELSESVGVLDEKTIQQIMPSHPAEALNRIAGVFINNLGGEGHMTSIRQPITTGGVYLFLEDGLPTRPTGFFNHNGLYEVNVPQAAQLEVTKGPGSALYGSAAIGGIINSLTKAPSAQASLNTTLEVGSDQWQRLLLDGSGSVGERSRVGWQINTTTSDGYRDEAGYDRASLTSRWDIDINHQLSAKTILTYTEVDQKGISSLGEDDYKNESTENRYHNDIGYREVEALRLSSEINYQINNDKLLTFIPFYRNNETALMPSWMITYDANIAKTEFETLGLLSKYRVKLGQGEFIVGVDLDHTSAEYNERRIDMVEDEDENYIGFIETGRTNYAYKADQLTTSPYFHYEWVAAKWHFSAGLRYDSFRVSYNDRLDASTAEIGPDVPGWGGSLSPAYRHLRPQSQTVTHEQWSPKLGAIYQLSDNQTIYFNYRHAFRTPTIGQLFRSGSSSNSAELAPVKAISYELGSRGQLSSHLYYELAIYHMDIEDDIVSRIDTSDRKTVNAGETSHRGVELGLEAQLNQEWSTGLSFTYTEQSYEDFSTLCSGTPCDFSGNDISKAPKTLGNLTIAYTPLTVPGLRLETEFSHLGDYYTDETNSQRYAGHDLVNLRASYQVNDQWQVYARMQNIADKRYSTYTSNRVGNTELDYRPGMPRSVFAGIKINF